MARIFTALMMLFFSYLLLAWTATAANPALYLLNVSFDIPRSKIIGQVQLDVQKGSELTLTLGRLSIIELQLNGKKLHSDIKEGVLTVFPLEDGLLSIVYEGVFKPAEYPGNTNYGVSNDAIDARGISLTGVWYPQPDFLTTYKLAATLPFGYTAICEAEKFNKKSKNGHIEYTFEFTHPSEGIHFIASNRYKITHAHMEGIEIYLYFFKEDRQLVKSYIEHAKKYLDLYSKLLVPYPYKRFSIVENFLPTGYSMPTFTLLGQDVVRLPFIVDTSLGHEILHQWFGNYVYVEMDKGNWAEGLTTYLADHFYEEQNGRGGEYRKQLLVDYESYVNDDNEFPLRKFRGRVDSASKAIGYGKAAMVFHMLKNLIGEIKFYIALKNVLHKKRFQRASWDDFQKEFENSSGKKLEWFFNQWIDRKGLPDLQPEGVTVRFNGGEFEVSYTLAESLPAYRLNIPVVYTFVQGGNKRDYLTIDKAKKNVTALVDTMPGAIAVDEQYDVARRLQPREFAPVISRLLGSQKIIIVTHAKDRKTYVDIIDSFKQRGGVEREADTIKDSEISSSSLIIMGSDNPLISRLFGKFEEIGAGFSLTMKENPWNPRDIVAIMNAQSREQAAEAIYKIFHYGKYSSLTFEHGKNVTKKISDSQRGIQETLGYEPKVMVVSALTTLADVVNNVRGKKIVYIGEYHDKFAHHYAQLQIIKALYAKDNKVAIGMEMFQRPFQQVLDNYVGGKINERTFLKQSEYFKRWGFDYNLNKPILDFARAERIPVIALNQRKEIVDKVAKNGLDSLSEEEKKDIPSQMNFADNEYRERLRNTFKEHEKQETSNFDFFYEAQILWDETMSWSIDEFINKNSGYRLIVLAGEGHLAYGSGIPRRTFRRNGFDYAIVLNDADIEKNIADYIMFWKPIEGVIAPKIMAFLKELNSQLIIEGFPDESVSKTAGLEIGDKIISLDGVSVRSVEDLKIELFYKKSGTILKVTILRKRFLFGEKEMVVEVKLQ